MIEQTYVVVLRVASAIFTTITFAIAAPFIWRFRKMSPIQLRTPSLVLAGSFALWVASVISGFVTATNSEDGIGSSISYLCYVISLGSLIPVFTRHFYLLKTSNLQQQIATNDDPENDTMFQLMTMKEWTTEKCAWYLFGITITIPFFTALGAMLSLSYDLYVFTVNMILLFQCLLLVGGGLYYLPRSKSDNLGMKRQFLVSVFLLTFYTLSVACTYAFRNNATLLVITTFLGSLIPCIVFFILVAWPAIVCYQIDAANKKKDLTYLLFQNSNSYDECSSPISPVSPTCQSPRSTSSTLPFLPTYSHKYRQTSMETLDVILKSPTLFPEFAKFLEREYSLELLLFLMAMKKYRNLGSKPSTTYNQAFKARNKVISEFILPQSPNKLDLPQNLVKPLQEILESPHEVRDCIMLFETEEFVRKELMENQVARFCKCLEGANAIV